MNLGLTILTITYIIFLVVPGLFFKRFFFKSQFHTDFYRGAFADRLVTSIFWGIIIQILSILIFVSFIDLSFEEFYKRSSNIFESLHKNRMPDVSVKQIGYLLLFFFITLSISCILGNFLYHFIRGFKLDIKFSALRFANEWNYTFRDELTTEDLAINGYKRVYLSTEIDIYMTDFNEERANFYTGTLDGYSLTTKGELDRISLTNAKKRLRSNKDPLELLEIKGDALIVPYCNIANMNLRFNYSYSYKTKLKGLPKAIKNAIILILVISLIPILIFPWFSSAGLLYKILGIIILILSWIIATGGTANFFDEDKNIKTRTFIFQIVFSIFLILIALIVLESFNIFKFFKYIIYYITQT